MRLAAILVLSSAFYGFAQDIKQARKVVDTLTSPYFWGRGYTKNGMAKAAEYLAAEFKTYGLRPLKSSGFLQSFDYTINSFPGKMEVMVDGQFLKPGVDFIVSPESKGNKAKGILVRADSAHFIDRKNKIEVVLLDKLTWSTAEAAQDYTRIEINKRKIPQSPQTIELNIENQAIRQFKASNICGIVRGTEKSDSLIVITAHYDHLGGMGDKTYFPGANDNASGTALLLSLAKHYSANPARYSIAFICFGGEEAGLVGSKYFSENPLFPLSKVRFLLNIDLAGTGEEGITAVNGSVFKNEFAILNKINDRKQYLSKIKSRGKAANSDHYWFTEKGVPSFFIYAMGGIQAYHDIDDRGETLPLTEFEDLFRLIVEFNAQLLD